MTDKTSRESDGNLVNVGNLDDKGANVNRNDPDNRNDNLGVSFSRSVPRLRGGVFRIFNPPANHSADFDDLFGKRCKSSIVDTLRLVCEPQMGCEHLESDVRFVEYQKSRYALLALCQIQKFDQFKDCVLDSRAERISCRLRTFQYPIMCREI